MSRVRFAANILKPLEPRSILDVGCRDAELARDFPNADYHGADLFPGERVSYVGDITQATFERTFDVVVACDILEHLDDPSAMFDRLVAVAERHLLISLPNMYDLKSRAKFAAKGRLGGKYVFTEETPLDRHRWLMSREEIITFCKAKAVKHSLKLTVIDMPYGSAGSIIGNLLSATLPRSLATATVFALFTR